MFWIISNVLNGVPHSVLLQVVMSEGDKADCMFFVLKGKVEAIMQGKVKGTKAKGTMFGERALTGEERRGVTARPTSATHSI